MSEYSSKLAAISVKKKKLLEQESRLVEKRKSEIAHLAERLDILSISNEIIAGLFMQAKEAITSKDTSLREWENVGTKLLKTWKQPRNRKAIKESTAETG